jgi:repressor LexA
MSLQKSTPKGNLILHLSCKQILLYYIYRGGFDMSITGDRLRALRQDMGLSQEEIAKKIGVSRPAYVNYEQGKSRPTRKLEELSALFNVTSDYIMGFSDNPHVTPFGNQTPLFSCYAPQRPIQLTPPEPINHAHYKIPILGAVSAGEPIETIEDICGYEYLDDRYENDGYRYFALKIVGDSMTPTIMNGDVVIVRQQPTVDSGQIAIVLVDGENATAKQIDISPSGITVIGHNAAVFAPRFVPNTEVKARLQILGRVMEVRRRF